MLSLTHWGLYARLIANWLENIFIFPDNQAADSVGKEVTTHVLIVDWQNEPIRFSGSRPLKGASLSSGDRPFAPASESRRLVGCADPGSTLQWNARVESQLRDHCAKTDCASERTRPAAIAESSPSLTISWRLSIVSLLNLRWDPGHRPFSSVCGDVEIEWVAETAEDELPALKSRDNAAVRAQGVCASHLPRKRCDGACV